MNGFLAITPIDRQQDWQKQGFYASRDFGIKHAPVLSLLPFFFDITSGLTVSEFKAQKISKKSTRTEVIIEDTVDFSGEETIETGTYSDRVVYLASNDIVGITAGYWRFYIQLSDTSEYISELMCVPSASEMISVLPDFNDDFNDDFLVI